jgi:hypothetical protein
MVMEKVDINRDEREARARTKAFEKARRRRTSSYGPGEAMSPMPSMLDTPKSADLPWISPQKRRFSSPMPKLPTAGSAPNGLGFKFAQSTTDLRALRTPSPSRISVAYSERPPSFWSRTGRSASQSVLSLAPSGSMMDMHLGLSMDKHLPETPGGMDHYDGALEENDSLPTDGETKKKKKGLKGFLSKLNLLSSDSKRSSHDSSPQKAPYYAGHYDDLSDPLPPPPSLSVLVDQRPHRRSASSSTQSSSILQTYPTSPASFPHRAGSPAASQPDLAYSFPHRNSMATVLSVKCSNNPVSPDAGAPERFFEKPESTSPVEIRTESGPVVVESGPATGAGAESVAPNGQQTSLLSPLEPVSRLRREKSLPALPTDDSDDMVPSLFPYPSTPPTVRESPSAYSVRQTSLLSAASFSAEKEFDEHAAASPRARARSKVFSFDVFKRHSSRPSPEPVDYIPHEACLDAVVRDSPFIALRYPSPVSPAR